MPNDKVTPISPHIKKLPDVRNFEFVVVPDKAEVLPISDDVDMSANTAEQTTGSTEAKTDAEDKPKPDHGARPMLW